MLSGFGATQMSAKAVAVGADGSYRADLSGFDGPVAATLRITDRAGNTASAAALSFAVMGVPVAQAQATAQGCDQVVWLDAIERTYVEEMGGMNLFFVYKDGRIVTPELTGTILEGVTRDSILELATDLGLKPVERRIKIDEWIDGCNDGTITEIFACGTAAVITPIGTVKGREESFTIGNGKAGPVAQRLRSLLVDIQRGNTNDAHGWFQKVF